MGKSISAIQRAIDFAAAAQELRDAQAILVSELQDFPGQRADAKRLFDEMDMTCMLSNLYKNYLIAVDDG